ncbi:hypothetical protein DQ244_00665 [Blastococcus sp. TBT05-19]|nr:hypothetical protein DQ244_00665 [Blastococcus sp. TBT05-19]
MLAWWIFWRLAPGLSRPRTQPVHALLLVFTLVLFLAYALGFDRGLLPLEARSTDRFLLSLGSWLGVALVAADGLRHRAEVYKVVKAVTLLAGFSAALGVLQFYGLDLVPYLRLPGLQYNLQLVGLGQRGGPGFSRVYGTQQHYIEFGVVLAMVLPLALHRALFARSKASARRRWVLLALVASAIPFSISRAGFLGLVVGLLVLASIWRGRVLRRAAVVAVVGLAAFRLVNPGVLGTIRSSFLNFDNDPSIAGRREDYEAVAMYFWDRPWFGRGPGTFVPEIYRVLDNQLLVSLLELGVIGTIALCALFTGMFGLGRQVRKLGRDEFDVHLGQAMAATAAVALLASFTFDSLTFPTFAGLFFLLLGLVAALRRTIDADGSTAPTQFSRVRGAAEMTRGLR